MSMNHAERRIWPPIFVKPITGPALGDMMTKPERTPRSRKPRIDRPNMAQTPESHDLIQPIAPVRVG